MLSNLKFCRFLHIPYIIGARAYAAHAREAKLYAILLRTSLILTTFAPSQQPPFLRRK